MDRVETQTINHKKEYATHSVKSSKQKIGDVIIFILLAIGAVAMIFPLIYMVATSFMILLLPMILQRKKRSEAVTDGS